MRRTINRRFHLMIAVIVMTAAASATHAQTIFEYENNATFWMQIARCHEAYSFDQYYAGLSNGTGCLSGSTNPVSLQLAGGTVTISAFNGATPVCPLQDSSTTPQACDAPLANTNSKVVFEFNPPVTHFYAYYGSLAVGATGTMKLYQNSVLQATLTSAASQNASLAIGHGFDAWATPIDRVEITTSDNGGAMVGAFVGLAANEPSLGTTTINNYNGPGGSQTVQLDFACTFQPTVQTGRVHNLTQNSWHGCIRDAIGYASNGDVLLVTESVYHEAIDFKGKSVVITSVDPNNPAVVENTIINAGINDWSAVRAVNGEGPNSQLVGLTITSGKGSIVSGEVRGGGLYALNSSPTIDRCHFIGNSAQQPNGFTGRGGAMYLGGTSSPTIVDCQFTGNTSYMGGAIYAPRGGWSVTDCTFTGNTASLRGGAISVTAIAGPSAVTVSNCTFEGNEAKSQGGAISAFDLSGLPGGVGVMVSISDTIFSTNKTGGGATGGAIWSENMRFNIDSCDFLDNASSTGAAMTLKGTGMITPSEVFNCRFSKNKAKPGDSGGILTVQASGPEGMFATVRQCVFTGNSGVRVLGVGDSTTTVASCTFSGNIVGSSVHANIALIYLDNCIIWDEVTPSVSESMEGNVLPTYCNLKGGGIGGVGVVSVDPQFVDALGPDGIAGSGDEDLRLMATSPSINAGVGTYDSKNPQFDFDGEPRHQGRIDPGAFEYPLDCNNNGVVDYTEIAQGLMTDCNDNLQSDACETELDGNCNGTLDMCELINGALQDTSPANGIPDEFEFGGVISGNQSWTLGNGPCIRVATQDVTVSGSLTIGAGIQVRMLGGVKWNVLSGGNLTVNGTAANPVQFTSVNANPNAGDWGGIRYAAGSIGSMTHASVRYTLNHGIKIESAPISVTDCTIADVVGINQPQGTSGTPAQVGGAAHGIFVSGNVSPTLARNVVERVRGGRGGRGAYANGGTDGTPGTTATNWGGNGTNGFAAVTNGSTGVAGANGGGAFGIYCGTQTNPTLRDNIVRAITGGDGGVGGGGGLGGTGGDGGHGLHCNIYVWTPVCYGGHGGNGGNGRHGGNAGPGGNGADAYGIRIESGAGGSVLQNLVASVVGGAGGQGGHGGRGGDGGAGGDGAFGMQGSVCSASPGPGEGGDGGNAGNGGNGGFGGQGGKSFGISIGTTPVALIPFVQNSIAQLANGAPGEAGEFGPSGAPGPAGAGGWGVKYITSCHCVPLPLFPTNGTDGGPGALGLYGVAGGAGDLTALRAEGQAILNVANSILHSSSADQSTGVTAAGSASLAINYSLLNGFQTPFGPGTSDQGVGNSTDNPMFIDPLNGDFHLDSASPAIDAGNNSDIPGGMTADLDGNLRIVDGDDNGSALVDLGAFERQIIANPCPADVTSDGMVNVNDLLAVINAWGPCPGDCQPDITGDGLVNVNDLLAVINDWGSCP